MIGGNDARQAELAWQDRGRGGGQDGDEGVEVRWPKQECTTLCPVLFKWEGGVKKVFRVQMKAVIRKGRSYYRFYVAIVNLRLRDEGKAWPESVKKMLQ